MKAPTRREIGRLTDAQLARTLRNIADVLWERYGNEPWPEEEEQPEALETLTSACDEIEELIA